MNALSQREMSYQQSLAAANRFTLEDIATNRGGAHQRAPKIEVEI